MRLLADENVHGKIIAILRARGYVLDWVKEVARSTTDANLLIRPRMSSTIFITNDRDFGQLIFQSSLPPPHAIIYTRTLHRDWRLTADLLTAELEAGVAPGQITTITKDRVRRRAFPAGANNG